MEVKNHHKKKTKKEGKGFQFLLTYPQELKNRPSRLNQINRRTI